MGHCCPGKIHEPVEPQFKTNVKPVPPFVRAPRLTPPPAFQLPQNLHRSVESNGADEESIPLTNFSDAGLTGLLVSVAVGGINFSLMPDTGNNTVILPYNDGLAVQNSDGHWVVHDSSNYKILNDNVKDSWSNEALLMSGPVKLGSREFTMKFFMRKDASAGGSGNFGMNFVGHAWYKAWSNGSWTTITEAASADWCPMLAAKWTYFQIQLVSPPTEGMQSTLILSNDLNFGAHLSFMKLMDTQVAQVRCTGYDMRLNGTDIASRDGAQMVAMVDSGGGAILCSNPAANDLATKALKSNAAPAFTWPNEKEKDEVLWLKEVETTFELLSDDGAGSFSAHIPAGDYTQLCSIPDNPYLNGQDGFNLGAQLFQYNRVVFDVSAGQVGFAKL